MDTTLREFAMSSAAVSPAAPAARAIDVMIGQYAESHRHPTNVLIHWICVPIIVWSVLALLHALHPWLAWIASAAALVYYARLSLPMALAMALFSVASLLTLPWVPYPVTTAIVAFIVTWILQFYGHHVEGKKPSFLDDLRFLLIGPVFLLAKAFRRLGLRY